MKKILLSLFIVVFLAAAGVFFLAATESGFRWMVHAATGLAGEKVKVGKVSGTLLSWWKVEALAIQLPTVHVTVFECSGDWQPARLLDKSLRVAEFHAQGVDIRLQEPKSSSVKKDKGGFDISSMGIPFSFFLDSFQVENMTVWDTKGAEITAIDSISFSLEGLPSQITLSDFVLSSPEYRLELEAALGIKDQGEARIAGNISYLSEEAGPLDGDFLIHGPLSLLVFEANVLPPVPVRITGELHNLFSTPSWRTEITVEGIHLSDIDPGAGKGVFRGAVKASGGLREYSGHIAGDAEIPGLGDVVYNASIKGDLDKLFIKDGDLQVPFGRVEVQGASLSWENELAWNGQLHIKDLDTGVLNPACPAKLSALVTSKGHYTVLQPIEGSITIEQLKGTLCGKGIEGRAKVDVGNNSIDISEFELVSNQSVLTIDGEVRTENGLLNLQLPLDWQLAVHMENFDPSIVSPDYPGRMNAHISSQGIIEEGKVSVDADIVELNGTLREYPLNGSGKLKVRDSHVEIEDFILRSGHSELTIQGRANSQLDLSVDLTSEDLGEVVAGAGGRLEIKGTVSGARQFPQVDLVVDAEGISYDDLRVESCHGHFSGSNVSQAEIVGSMTGTGIDAGGFSLDTVNLSVDGAAENHALSFEMKSGKTTVSGKADGSIEENSVWKSEFMDLKITSPDLGNWNQEDPVLVEASKDAVTGGGLCLSAGRENICLSGNWSRLGNEWGGGLEWQNLNLGRLGTLDEDFVEIAGQTSGTVAISGNAERVAFADAHMNISQVRIGEGADRGDWELCDIKELTLDIVLENETLKGDLMCMMDDGNHLVGYAVVPGVGFFHQDYSSLPLAGELEIAAVDLDFVAPLTNYYVYPTGDLKGELQLSGTLFDPKAAGDLTLFNGRIDFPTFGVSLKDAIFKVVGEGVTLQIRGEGTSGPGRLYADGSLSFEKDDVDGEFNFVGQNIDTFNLPEYEIRTSPDLRLVFDSGGGSLVGELFVPHARLTPENMTGSLSVSDDVVFLDEQAMHSTGGWQFTTILDVELGEDVQLDGYGLTGYLQGELAVNKLPGMFVTGQGVLTLEEGEFSIYGRSLEIERSRVLFSGGAIDDPGLDVRAQKVVADKEAGPNGVLVGVDVSGTVEDLEFKLFSDPYMDETDILAYMVVGRSMSDTGNDERNILSSAAMALGVDGGTGLLQGLTKILPVDDVYFEGETSGEDERLSLVVGKKLTDELFIGYDHNFFDQVGEMTIRYELGKGFYIESRTSGDATGADLLFSFER